MKRSNTKLLHKKNKESTCDVCGYHYYAKHLKQYDYTIDEVSLSMKDKECIKCEFCLRNFNRLTGLIEHLQTSHIKNKFKCCDIIFGNIDLLKNHINRNHDKEFKCDICENIFLKRHERELHIESVHRKTSRCQVCGNEFSSGEDLKIHLQFVHGNAIHVIYANLQIQMISCYI